MRNTPMNEMIFENRNEDRKLSLSKIEETGCLKLSIVDYGEQKSYYLNREECKSLLVSIPKLIG